MGHVVAHARRVQFTADNDENSLHEHNKYGFSAAIECQIMGIAK